MAVTPVGQLASWSSIHYSNMNRGCAKVNTAALSSNGVISPPRLRRPVSILRPHDNKQWLFVPGIHHNSSNTAVRSTCTHIGMICIYIISSICKLVLGSFFTCFHIYFWVAFSLAFHILPGYLHIYEVYFLICCWFRYLSTSHPRRVWLFCSVENPMLLSYTLLGVY